jgi:hypothetical protein
MLLRAGAACGLLVVLYYLAPFEPEAAGAELVVRLVLATALGVTVMVIIVRLVVRMIRKVPGTRPANLVVALFAAVVLFAAVDYLVAVTRPGQFQELETKTDALYFAVTTMATVGYGDVHASGQLARGLVTVQLLFNLTVLATGGAVLVNRIVDGAGRRG